MHRIAAGTKRARQMVSRGVPTQLPELDILRWNFTVEIKKLIKDTGQARAHIRHINHLFGMHSADHAKWLADNKLDQVVTGSFVTMTPITK